MKFRDHRNNADLGTIGLHSVIFNLSVANSNQQFLKGGLETYSVLLMSK